MHKQIFFVAVILLVLVLIPVVSAADPWEGYIPSSVTGPEPLIVSFTDISYNSPTSWVWWFKDVTGNNTAVSFSTVQNPTHPFSYGNYSIWLNASNSYGYNITPNLVFVNVSRTAPMATFTSNVTSGLNPLAVQFNDTSYLGSSSGEKVSTLTTTSELMVNPPRA